MVMLHISVNVKDMCEVTHWTSIHYHLVTSLRVDTMAPDVSSVEVIEREPEFEKLVAPQAAPRKYQIVYRNILTFGYAHLTALLYPLRISITAGAHRLWTHRAYKAKLPLQIILVVLNSLAFQNTAIDWVRDHRLHHRYSDTDADPHNATRGFFYSHIGWLLVRKHEEVKRRGKFIDMSDIYANPVLCFQRKYAIPFIGTICFVLPTIIPMYFFGESLKTAWCIAVLRYVLNLHIAFLVNSAAHIWGNKPYDRTIKPVQSLPVSFVAFGEGFHNYHHVFPWDYRTAELGNNYLNLTTIFIDFFAKIGWAYDLKSVNDDMIKSRSDRTGDGTNMWGFGDKKNCDKFE
ncbi:Acyl-CoA Delta(11) desaturase [Papilio xuthus]|uniref:Acyl-CoA Delta(11) desaturase n=1 Tax=Papilio xuthus TaxID=66420 RepID=A0A194Q9S9_PAPXU|nr:Acyl-CoA Delta(11) desaturase [Papilio xuthus]